MVKTHNLIAEYMLLILSEIWKEILSAETFGIEEQGRAMWKYTAQNIYIQNPFSRSSKDTSKFLHSVSFNNYIRDLPINSIFLKYTFEEFLNLSGIDFFLSLCF